MLYHDSGAYAEPASQCFPVRQPIVWEDLEGELTTVVAREHQLDFELSLRVPPEKIQVFLSNWSGNYSNLTLEDCRRLEQENPFSVDFQVILVGDGGEWKAKQWYFTVWHPFSSDREHPSEEAEKLMAARRLDRKNGWLFVRFCYRWDDPAPVRGQDLRLLFRQEKTPVTAGYVTTEASSLENISMDRKVEVCHPVTGIRYFVTLHSLKAESLTGEGFEAGTGFPSCYQSLSYSVTPELPPDEFRLQDTAQSDAPVEQPGAKGGQGSSVAIIGGAHGPTAVFIGDGPYPRAHRVAYSALHWKPFFRVKWELVFYQKKRRDMEITVPLTVTQV